MPKRKLPTFYEVPRGTPHQWAWANQLALAAGYRTGVGEVLREMRRERKPRTFEGGVQQMHPVIDGLEQYLGIRRNKRGQIIRY